MIFPGWELEYESEEPVTEGGWTAEAGRCGEEGEAEGDKRDADGVCWEREEEETGRSCKIKSTVFFNLINLLTVTIFI